MRKAVRGLYRRADAEAWSYDFVIAGHRFCGSTGLASRREAEQWLIRFRAEKGTEVAQLSGLAPMSFGAASTRWWQERGQHRKDARTLEGALTASSRRKNTCNP